MVAAATGPRTYRVDQILRPDRGRGALRPPADFDLAGYWRRYQADFHARLHAAEALIRLSPGAAARSPGPPRGRWPSPAPRTRTAGSARRCPPSPWTRRTPFFLSLGAEAEVLAPPELRSLLAATARALAAAYQG